MTNEEFILTAANVAEIFRVQVQNYGDEGGFMSLFRFREFAIARGVVGQPDFAHFMMRLHDESLAGALPYNVEFKGPETPVEVATAGRLKPESCIMFWNGEKQVTVMRVRITNREAHKMYEPFERITWADVGKRDEIYIDNYESGRFSMASPQISGPYVVLDLTTRRLSCTWPPFTAFMYYPNNLLRKKE